MEERGIRRGFGFLAEPTSPVISESLLTFDSADSALWVLAAGRILKAHSSNRLPDC